MKNKALFSIGTVLGITLSIFLISFSILAWTGPTLPPPGGNVPAPLNVGSEAQTKAGTLTTQQQLRASEVCIGGVCRSTWPAGDGGGITSLSELNIDISKNWGGHRIRGVGTPLFSADVATKSYVDSQVGSGGGITSLSQLTIDISKDWGGHRIRNVATPSLSSDVATKGYVDSRVGSGGGGITSLSQLTIDISKDWGGHRIRNVGTPLVSSDVATKGYVDSQSGGITRLSQLTIDTEKHWGGNRILGLGYPTWSTDAANKGYVDSKGLVCVTRSANCSYHCTIGCPRGYTVTGGGIRGSAYGNIGNMHDSWSGTAWHCAINLSSFTCEARCCRIQ